MTIFSKLGSSIIGFLDYAGRMGIFLFYCLISVIVPPYKIRPIIQQIYFIGASSVFVILFTGAFTGMVLGLQGYYSLRQFGSEGALGSAVGLSLVRELGPVLTALMVTGRAGSAICAEIGIMRNSEQIDALECMAIDPYKFIIAPKLVAAIICIPLLTSLFDCIGIIGGFAVGVDLLGVNEGAYFYGLYKSVVWQDVHMGIIKSLAFAVIIIWICAAKGFYLHLDRLGFGAEGVSRATTQAVVLSSVAILVFDYLITAILL
ncbi:MAG: MlaE family ABC transporter permease [Dissulfurimicrobium sp.]|uniref:MlaE family ABC transporter permease n=1 Tax=Dissulfurimicrobium TaxID=1769732 RepID=UPI001ED9F5ED|nr:MlaE family lipid ABC transporter permease subunit [Dissulfurimicrobium hydrothermale]UKL13206.1 MlaE family lipid ABC transporter permease subunit [Dissulfurimicrobium hydrothermale]